MMLFLIIVAAILTALVVWRFRRGIGIALIALAVCAFGLYLLGQM
jgi:hypothetical protein